MMAVLRTARVEHARPLRNRVGQLFEPRTYRGVAGGAGK